MMSALGGAARLISKQGYSPRFSPDGKWITYWTGFVGPNFLRGTTQVYVLSLANGEVKQIASEFSAVRQAIWMKDNRHLLLVGRLDSPESLDWWVVSMDGGKPIRTGVFAALRQRGLSYPLLEYAFIPESFAADSKHILFSAKLGDSTNVWQIALTPDKYQVEGPPRQLTSGTGLELQATSVGGPSGKPIFIFASLARTVDVWCLPINADQGKVTGEIQPLTRASSFNAWPNLSADGTKLAYVAYESDRGTVWFRDLKKTDATALNITLSGEIQPRLSPDGLRVAYGDEKSKTGYVAEMQGVAVEKVCDKCSVPTTWSPDGRTLVFESGGGQYSVVIIDLATKRRIERSSRLHQMLNATRLSPDGHWASFHMRNSPITRKIFVARFQDGTIADEDSWIPITDGSAMDREAGWSPSGNVLYFLSERDGHRCIWAQRLDAQSKRPVGSAFAVLHLHGTRESIAEVGPNVGAVGLSVAADKLAFAMGTLTGNLWMREFTGR
jgi:Tol biopolymer transport system component